MRQRRLFPIALLLAAILPGCRFPGWDSPISQSLVNSRKLCREGVTAMEKGEHSQAETLLAKAVHACPTDTEARRNYAEALWQRGAQKEAIGQMELGAKTAGDDVAFRVRLAEMYLAAGQPEQADKNAEIALGLDPKSPAAWAIHGGVMKAKRQPQQALAAYLHALGLDPQDRISMFEVAELYRLQNQPERALQTLQTLADNYPPGEVPQDVLYLTGAAYLALNRPEEAVENMRAAVQCGKPSSDLYCRLAEAEFLAGNAREAMTAANQSLALQPRHSDSLEVLQRIQIAEQSRGDRILK
jgi:tetratricopeptide (TPR) repeat protein